MKSLMIKDKSILPYASREAMNRLRINFDFCGDQYKKVMVTSSTPDEGKSFVSYQLWRVLAESGKHVVLVDADLRRSDVRPCHAPGPDGPGLLHCPDVRPYRDLR